MMELAILSAPARFYSLRITCFGFLFVKLSLVARECVGKVIEDALVDHHPDLEDAWCTTDPRG